MQRQGGKTRTPHLGGMFPSTPWADHWICPHSYSEHLLHRGSILMVRRLASTLFLTLSSGSGHHDYNACDASSSIWQNYANVHNISEIRDPVEWIPFPKFNHCPVILSLQHQHWRRQVWLRRHHRRPVLAIHDSLQSSDKNVAC